MRRKIGSFLLVVSILLVLMPDTAMAARMERTPTAVREATDVFPEGSGSETDPYRIGDAGQLRAFADMVNDAGGAAGTGICAVLTQDIDLSAVCGGDIGSWSPIGTKARPYTGIFDGASFAVRGLYYNAPGSSYAGLFGCNSGVIKNLGVAGGEVTAGSYTGSVCGFNSGTITGCYNAASVKGGRYTGGVCGCNDGSVSVCYNTGAVSGSKYVGGICGYNRNTTADCYNIGGVDGSGTSVGGICGYNKKQVSDCYNTGAVSGKGTAYVGSICGYNHSESTFLNCYYLITGTEKGNYGDAKTWEQFAAGEVCWLLNGGKSEDVVWYQTCGEGFPAFGGKTVYQVQAYRGNGSTKELVVSYTNERNGRGAAPYTAAAGNPDDHPETDSGADTDADSGTDSEKHVYREPEWNWKEYEAATAVFTCTECGEKITLEAVVKRKDTKPTCVAEGKTVYTASVSRDGKTYQDTKTVVIAKTGHQSVKAVTAAAATCEVEGIKRDCWSCPVCGKYFEDQEGNVELSKSEVVEPALGHKYGAKYEWDWKGVSSAVLIFQCDNGCGKTVTEKANLQSETTATCTTPGRTVYTATVQYNGRKYEDTKTVEGQTLPHDYSGKPEWEWSNDNSSATAVFRCSYGCGQTVETEGNVRLQTKDATCTVPGTTVYTATVEYNGEIYEDTQTAKGQTIPHDYGGEPKWKWASGYSSATATFSCIYGCGHTVEMQGSVRSRVTAATCTVSGTTVYTATVEYNGETFEDTKTDKGQTIPHDYSGEPQWEWADDNSSATAVFSCSYGCGASESAQATVTSSRSEAPDCSTPGRITYTAVVTYQGRSYTDTDETEIPAQHTLAAVPAREAKCEQAGNKEYWKCSRCGKCFSDGEGGNEIAESATIISEKGHDLQHEENNRYRCARCGGTYLVTVTENGTRSFYSLEEVTEQAGQAEPEEATEQAKQADPEEATEQTGQSGEDEKQDGEEISGGIPAEEQDGQSGQAEQADPGEATEQTEQAETEEVTEQAEQADPGEATEQTEQAEETGDESGDGASEENAHYGLVYPAGEEEKAYSMISKEWEGSAVSLRAEPAASGEAQEERAGWPFGASVAALAALAGLILFFFLRGKET